MSNLRKIFYAHNMLILPFAVLIGLFVGFRLPLLKSALIALISSMISIYYLSSDGTAFLNTTQEALLKGAVFITEIGGILWGAFFFMEAAEHSGVLASISTTLKRLISNRIALGLGISFGLNLLIEGSSGFGTPVLITAPLLASLGFPPLLAAILPFINCVVGIPFGALGTPLRLGFPSDTFAVDYITLAEKTYAALEPFCYLTPLVSVLLIKRYDPESKSIPLTKNIWAYALGLGAAYRFGSTLLLDHGPDFVSALGGFFALVASLVLGILLFPSPKDHSRPQFHGIFVYGLLLGCLFLGKLILGDQRFTGFPIRQFNPGIVFFIFGILISIRSVKKNFKQSTLRGMRTLGVLTCLSLIVQMTRASGLVESSLGTLPGILRTDLLGVLSWALCALCGTSTISNLLLSRGFLETSFPVIAAGGALGVMMAFQTITGVKAILKDRFQELDLLKKIAPLSVGFLLVLIAWIQIKTALG